MVVFTCNHCGESLQKPRVEKHYQITCRNPISVTCMDCFKDFKLLEYATHNKCITEEQRYSAKGTVQGGAKKGELKQLSWVAQINNILETHKNLKPKERELLEFVSKNENVPRKKPKFINFMKSSSGGRVNLHEVESVWNIIESYKTEESKNGNEKVTDDISSDSKKSKNNNSNEEQLNENNTEESAVESKKSKKKKRKAEVDDSNVEVKKVKESEVNEEKSSKKKKRKAQELENIEITTVETITEPEVPKKKKKKNKNIPDENMEISENNVNKKDKKKDKENVIVENGTNETKKKKNELQETNGTSEENVKPKEKKKKNKKEIKNNSNSEAEINGDSKNKSDDSNIDVHSSMNDFSWQRTILEILNKKKSMPKQELQRAVVKEFKKIRGVVPDGKEIKHFQRKLNKLKNVKCENDVVTLE